jgi:AraC-like DNA-binding protein
MSEYLTKKDYFEDTTLPLQVYIRDPHPEFPLHTHGFDELVIILRGTAVHVVDGQPFPVRSGDVFVVSGLHEHQYLDMCELALANILFDSKALQMDRWDIRALPGFHALFALEPVLRSQQKFNSRLHLSERQLNHVNELLHDLMRETDLRSPGYRVMAKGLFMQLAVYLSRCWSDKPSEESIDLLRLGHAIAMIETRFAEKITLEDLARTAHLSKRHFQRIFQECLGQSPIDYLLHIRIQKAAELLHHSSRSITDIAFECGFTDSNYFTRQFRRIAGRTPRQFRMNSSDFQTLEKTV